MIQLMIHLLIDDTIDDTIVENSGQVLWKTEYSQ